MELPVVITNCQKTGVCPMTDVRWRDRVAKTREKYYTVVDCYGIETKDYWRSYSSSFVKSQFCVFFYSAIINNPRDISQKRDLAICSFGIQCRDPNSKKVIEGKREFFGYLLTGSNNTTPITGNSIIHQELKNKSSSFFLNSYTISCTYDIFIDTFVFIRSRSKIYSYVSR